MVHRDSPESSIPHPEDQGRVNLAFTIAFAPNALHSSLMLCRPGSSGGLLIGPLVPDTPCIHSDHGKAIPMGIYDATGNARLHLFNPALTQSETMENMHERQLPPKLARCLVFDMIGTALRVLDRTRVNYVDVFGEGFDPVDELMAGESVPDTYRRTKRIYREVCRYLNGIRNGGDPFGDFVGADGFSVSAGGAVELCRSLLSTRPVAPLGEPVIY